LQAGLVGAVASGAASGRAGSDGAGSDWFGLGAANHAVTRCETTTATMTNGVSVAALWAGITVASSTQVSGRRSIETDTAPIPIAVPVSMGSPGRCDIAIPSAAPRNSDGNTGPPRNEARQSM